jgi:hypothetical protein
MTPTGLTTLTMFGISLILVSILTFKDILEQYKKQICELEEYKNDADEQIEIMNENIEELNGRLEKKILEAKDLKDLVFYTNVKMMKEKYSTQTFDDVPAERNRHNIQDPNRYPNDKISEILNRININKTPKP